MANNKKTGMGRSAAASASRISAGKQKEKDLAVKALKIVDAALKLPEATRAAVVERLLESLPAKSGTTRDEAWAAEIAL